MPNHRISFPELLQMVRDAQRLDEFERSIKPAPGPEGVIEYLEVPTGDAFDVKPLDAIKFFQRKGLRTTESYADMTGAAHAEAFTIAKMMDVDLLGQVRDSLSDALANGVTFEDWAKEVGPMLDRAGWKGNTPWRLETIFRTNMQSAYAAGQWREIVAQSDIAPFLLYDAIDDHRTRPLHHSWDNTVLPVGHAWWNTHYPPCGWNCRCGVIQLSADELRAMGLAPDIRAPDDGNYHWTNPRTGEQRAVPQGLDPGFDHNAGTSYMADLLKLYAEKVGALPADMQPAAAVGLQASQEQAAAVLAQLHADDSAARTSAALAINAASMTSVTEEAAAAALADIAAGVGAYEFSLLHEAYLRLVNNPAFKVLAAAQKLAAVRKLAAELKSNLRR